MSGRTAGSIGLLVIAAFMLFGFVRSDASLAAPATVAALLLTVVLPAAAGVAMLAGVPPFGGRRKARLEQLRRQTVEAEILRLAIAHAGRLTVIEVATALAVPPESAKATLDALAEREIADLEITDAGVIVYNFHDAGHLGGKHSARGLLDA